MEFLLFLGFYLSIKLKYFYKQAIGILYFCSCSLGGKRFFKILALPYEKITISSLTDPRNILKGKKRREVFRISNRNGISQQQNATECVPVVLSSSLYVISNCGCQGKLTDLLFHFDSIQNKFNKPGLIFFFSFLIKDILNHKVSNRLPIITLWRWN